MSAAQRLTPHPRLYLRPRDIARLTDEPELPFLRRAAEQVTASARRFLHAGPVPLNPDVHNGHLIRARQMQTRIVTLLARFRQTGSERYRRAVIDCVSEMNAWEHWSWIAWRAGDPAHDAIFDLSYGENSATLAIAYTWLHDTLSAAERGLFIDTARSWALASGLKNARKGVSWWFGCADSNWNTVCAGGLGMLCLAMFEDAPEPKKILPRCETSIIPFMKLLNKTDGGWTEGIGYWNYGFRYAFMYLLSHEAATGKAHPLMKLRGARQTLSFPLDFTPHGVPCSFGDVNRWNPLPFHIAAARRLKRRDVLAELDERLDAEKTTEEHWPHAAELLMFHPGKRTPRPRTSQRPFAKLYRGIDWGVLADRPSSPELYAAVRGGSTRQSHNHLDLLSFHVVVGNEQLITDVKPAEYLDSTFSPRRRELFEISPDSKNTLFVNGLGVVTDAELNSTTSLKLSGARGFRLDASNAFGLMRDDAMVRFCARAALLLDENALLVVDRVELPFTGRVEARMHTFARLRTGKTTATIRGRKHACRVTFAADVPTLLTTALTAHTTPTAPAAHVLRWCTAERLERTVTFATLITPTAAPARLELTTRGKRIALTASTPNGQRTLDLTTRLRSAR